MNSLPVHVGTFTTDASLIVRTWSTSLAELSGIAAADAVGHALQDLIPSLAPRGLLPRFQEVLQGTAVHVFSPAIHHYLLPCPPHSPSRRFVHMQQRATIGPLRVGERIEGVIVTIEDVTERIEAEHDLAASLAGAGEWSTRRAAVQRLSEAPPSDFTSSLVEVVRTHHRDFGVLSSALQLLAGTDADVSAPLVDLLRDHDPDLRIQAALALGVQRGAAAEDALIGALLDEHVNVRFQAIESLGRLRARRAVDALVRIAEDDDAFLAFAAVEALAAIGDAGVVPRLVPLLARDELKSATIEALGMLADENAIESLGVVLRPSDVIGAVKVATPEHLPALVRILGWMDADEARAALIDLLPVATAREPLFDALARQGERIVDRLVVQLSADDDDVRDAAVAALGRIGSCRATSALVALIAGSGRRRALIASVLGQLRDPEAFECLLGLIGDHDAAVRHAAVGALNALSHPDMPARITALLDSDDLLIVESAVRIAGYFGYPGAGPRIAAFATQAPEPVRCAAIEQLPHANPESAARTIIAALGTGTPAVRVAAVKALAHVDEAAAHAALVAALSDGDMWVRYFACRSLGEVRHAGAGEVLGEIARTDPVPPVRIAAGDALRQLERRGADGV